MKKGKKQTYTILAILFWAGLWILVSSFIKSDLIIPGPLSVLSALMSLLKKGSFLKKILSTVFRIGAGFVLGSILAVVLAIVSYKNELCEAIVSFFVKMVRAIPVASFIVLVLLWVKTDRVPLLIASLIVLPIVYTNTLTGLMNVDWKMLEVAKVFNMDQVKKLKYIYIPSLKGYIASSLLTALGLAFKSGIAAEVIALPKYAIGSEIYNSKIYLETPELFAWTFVLVILSVLLEKILKYLILKVGGRQ